MHVLPRKVELYNDVESESEGPLVSCLVYEEEKEECELLDAPIKLLEQKLPQTAALSFNEGDLSHLEPIDLVVKYQHHLQQRVSKGRVEELQPNSEDPQL